MKKALLLLTILLCFTSNTFSQKEANLLNPKRPSVYIQSLSTKDNGEQLRLELHNNSRWTISFCSGNADKYSGDIRIVYEIKKQFIRGRIGRGTGSNSVNSSKQKEETIPNGFSTGDTCTPFNLASGKSVKFSIPRSHISEKFFIEIEFWYDWENRYNETGNYPRNLITFHNSQLN